MREIKFRGQRADSMQYVYGYYIAGDKKHYIASASSPFDIHYEVIPETIGEFSGMTDRNRKDIYEGHILFVEKAKRWMSGDGRLPKGFPQCISGYCLVEFKNGEFEFEWIKAIAAHEEFGTRKFYREIGYLKHPLGKGSKAWSEKTGKYSIVGDGKINTHVEIVEDESVIAGLNIKANKR